MNLVQIRVEYWIIGYLEHENLLKSTVGITGSSYDFTRLSAETKTSYLYRLTRHLQRGKLNTMNHDYFYSGLAL